MCAKFECILHTTKKVRSVGKINIINKNLKFRVMTLTNIISNLETKQLLKLYNSQKYYFYFNISVFNTGAVINPICTNTFKQINYRTWNGYNFISENDDLIHYIIESELLERNALKLHYFRFVVPDVYERTYKNLSAARKKAKQLNENVFLTIFLYRNKLKEPYNDMQLNEVETLETIAEKKAILLDKTRKYFN